MVRWCDGAGLTSRGVLLAWKIVGQGQGPTVLAVGCMASRVHNKSANTGFSRTNLCLNF